VRSGDHEVAFQIGLQDAQAGIGAHRALHCGGDDSRRLVVGQRKCRASANASATPQRPAPARRRGSQPAPSAEPAGPPPVGTTVTTLPPGCAPVKLNNVDYMRCDSTYYTAAMMGTTVVFVVAQP
jgi:hypothetical protein